MARILLINPPKEVPLLNWTMRYPPLGLMSLAASVEGHDVEILDMRIDNLSGRALDAKLASADIVGLTALTPSIDSALELSQAARARGALTVLGGFHPSLVPQVASYPQVDVVVRGEGELTFREIADGKPFASVAGTSFKGAAGLVHNPDRPPADLGSLPPPRRDLVSKYAAHYMAFGKSLDALSTARGCPYRCSFCCVPVLWRGYRELSPAQVVAEIRRMGPTEIVSIVDDNFCHDMNRVAEICDLMVREGFNDRIYSVFSRVDSIVQHPDVVEKMAAAGMRVVFIGIEAATQEALDRMGKKTRLEDIERACRILDSNGILIWAGHIIGNMDDTWEDVEALIRMSTRLPVDIAQFTVITPYPGTELFRDAGERGLIDDLDYPEYCECEPHMHTPHLSRMEITELEIKAYVHFYGFRAMLKRVRRYNKSADKKWIVKGNLKGVTSFSKFRNKSAFYFWRTYREMVGETEGTRIRRFSPLVSTPHLYALAAAIVAALITLAVTILAGTFYGDYRALPRAFVFTDLLVASAFVAFFTGVVSSLLAVRSYRHGWIFSVRARRPVRSQRSPLEYALLSGAIGACASFILAVIMLVGIALGGASAQVTYATKEYLVTVIAFLAAGAVSYDSIHAVRNGAIARARA